LLSGIEFVSKILKPSIESIVLSIVLKATKTHFQKFYQTTISNEATRRVLENLPPDNSVRQLALIKLISSCKDLSCIKYYFLTMPRPSKVEFCEPSNRESHDSESDEEFMKYLCRDEMLKMINSDEVPSTSRKAKKSKKGKKKHKKRSKSFER